MISILLILPFDFSYRYRGAFKKSYSYTPLTLYALAAHIPPGNDFSVDIIDEGVEPVSNFSSANYDIVGITCVTSSAPRAYELSSIWRKKGSYVVLGGAHPTLLPGDAMQHADTVITGAAEINWPTFLQDFRNGSPKPMYMGNEELCEAQSMIVPRRDLIKKGRYLNIPTIIARPGCQNNCSFCSIPHLGYSKAGARKIGDIISEIKSLNSKKVLFLDPNITVDIQYAKELFTALIPCKIKWGGLSSLHISDNPELVTLMAKSGCIGLLIGFESFNQQNLVSSQKHFATVSKYRNVIAMLHDNFISILGCFVLGFDNDTKESLLELPDLVDQLKIDLPRYSILTPFPGTKCFTSMDNEGRILTRDWSLYDTEHVVFKPKNLEPDELQNALYAAWKNSYSISRIFKRSLDLDKNRLFGILMNFGFRHYGKKLYSLRRQIHGTFNTD
jgi:radical SAM superfamily enzyme YgiQ (UPF0313 family)